MTRIENALKYFGSGYSCSQAILSAFGESFGLDEELAIKLACAFGGGISHRGEMCGAVTGALMVLGLKYGATGDAKQHTYEIANDFISRFSAQNGTAACKDLLGYNLSIPEECAAAKQQDIFSKKCRVYVQSAAEILEEML